MACGFAVMKQMYLYQTKAEANKCAEIIHMGMYVYKFPLSEISVHNIIHILLLTLFSAWIPIFLVYS
jgi:hypothetical protein